MVGFVVGAGPAEMGAAGGSARHRTARLSGAKFSAHQRRTREPLVKGAGRLTEPVRRKPLKGAPTAMLRVPTRLPLGAHGTTGTGA